MTVYILGFPGGSAGKESTCNTGDLGSIPGLGRSLRKGKSCTLQNSGLEKSMDSILHIVVYKIDHKESWMLKNRCFWIVVLEKTLKSLLDCKKIHPIHPKGDQSWVFIGRTDAEAEAPIIWLLDVKKWLIWKDPDAGKERLKEKGTTEDQMVRWHHHLHRHEFGQASGVGDGQGSLACCSPWGSKELDTTEIEKWKWNSLSRVWLFATPWAVQSVEFSRPEYWSG